MFASRGYGRGPDRSDRSGPECRKMFGCSVTVTLQQGFVAAVSPAWSIPPSANRKRPRSISRVFQSIGGAFRWRDLLSGCGSDSGWIRYPRAPA